MSIHLIWTDRFGRRSYLLFSFYIIQNSQPKVNYPSRLVPIPLVYLFPTYPIHPFPMHGCYYLSFFSFLFSFHTHPSLNHPLLEPCMCLLAFVHYGHVLSESMLFSVSSRILLSRTRLRVLPWFVHFLCPFFFSFLFLPFFFQI